MPSPDSLRGSLTSEDVRRHNLGLVALALTSGPLSRSELALETGLTRGAITSLSAELIEHEIIRESDRIAPEGRGRPKTLLELSATDVALIIATLDADRVEAVVSTLDGQRLARFSERHGRPIGDPGPVIDALAQVISEALSHAATIGRPLADLSVVVWAPVGGAPAVVLADTDLGWERVDVIGLLQERLPRLSAAQIPLIADTSVAALEEHVDAGAPDHLVYLKSDSGIGGAVFADGRALTGAAGWAGMLGHLPVIPDGALCECGQHGCLVTVAGPDALLSATGLAESARDEGLDAALDRFVAGVREGSPQHVSAWTQALPHIARTLQIALLTVGADRVVLGGYLASFVDDIGAELTRIAVTAGGAVPPHVSASRLGPDAALLGAERAARLRMIDTLLA
ncbi:ROK family protein [Microbacterium sp. ZW T5_56]|uniref:ROK family protein n=1 Tax=Microbacterium sp. ZW T5_56 TaxID=3378081 RepID=UPI0038524E4D